jgi:glycosyltransferase involved in cell wall biosynthesis
VILAEEVTADRGWRGDEVHIVTPYGRGAGSSRVRVFEWTDRVVDRVEIHPYAGLAGASPEDLVRHSVRVGRAERSLRALAVSRPAGLLIHREASPLSRGGLEERLLGSAGFGVYELDDALYTDVGDGPRYRRLAPKGPKATVAARLADRVIAGNATLANWASDHNRDVVLIPSCVDPASYELKSRYEVGDPPVLGWIGSWSTEIHVASIGKALLRLHRDLGARLRIVGITRRGLGELEVMIDRIPWSVEHQRTETARFDVGIMPLRDDPYARGKCAYKLLQYMAAGVPAVGTPVGMNAEVLAAAGLPAVVTVDDWYDAIRRLLEMPAEAREAAGRAAYDVVRTRYSFDVWRDTWRRATGLTG